LTGLARRDQDDHAYEGGDDVPNHSDGDPGHQAPEQGPTDEGPHDPENDVADEPVISARLQVHGDAPFLAEEPA
jgi:hypothetical protein